MATADPSNSAVVPSENTPVVLSSSAKKWLYLIIVLAVLVRVMAGYLQPAFIDEAYVYYMTKAGMSQLLDAIRYDVHPPTLNILLYPLIQSTTSIFLLRLPQIILSALTVLLVCLLSRRYFPAKTALIITACFAFSYSIWLTDAQLRTYGPLTCASTALILGLLTAVQYGRPFSPYLAKESPWGWTLLALAALGCSCLHVGGLLLLLTAGVFFLLPVPIERAVRGRILLVLALSAVPIVIWALYARLSIPLHFSRPPKFINFDGWFGTPVLLASGLYPKAVLEKFHDSWFVSACASYITPVFLLLNLVAWLAFLRGARSLEVPYQPAKALRVWEHSFLFSTFAAPCLFYYVANLFQVLSWQSRYLSPLLAPFLIVVFAGSGRWGRRALAALILTVNAVMIISFPFCTWLWNQCWQDTIDFIEARQRPGDHIAIYIPYACCSFAMAYDIDGISYTFFTSSGANVQMKQIPNPSKLPVIGLNAPAVGTDYFNTDYWRSGRIFFIITQPDAGANHISEILNRDYTVVDYCEHQALVAWASATTYMLERK